MSEEIDKFVNSLDADDIRRLHSLISILRRVDGWCKVNRFIGRWIIFTLIATLIIMVQGYDAIIRVVGAIRGH
jgi:hypothetical protein